MSTQNKLLAIIALATGLIAIHFIWHDVVIITRIVSRTVSNFVQQNPRVVAIFATVTFLAIMRALPDFIRGTLWPGLKALFTSKPATRN